MYFFFVGFDFDLLKRFQTIIGVTSGPYNIEPVKFKDFCFETTKRFISLYGWYYFATSAHTVLMHGWRVIDTVMMPIGELSEEPIEHIQKKIKRTREDFTRKMSA